MKRSLLFSALVLVIATSMSYAQGSNPRRVLVEEFTNTGCPPCATSDPFVEDFENLDQAQICSIKWHVSWPDGTDPFYNAYLTGTVRAQSYYGVTGVPDMIFSGDGSTHYNPLQLQTADGIKSVADQYYANGSPYKMSVKQRVTSDSIFADVTVTTTDAVPTAKDLRLAVVFCERYSSFHGSNGRPHYTNIGRQCVPALTASGVISTTTQYPAFSLAQGSTQTHTFGAKINPKWNLSQMVAVSFIQSAGSKEVFQANWTVPDVTVTGDDGTFSDFPITSSSAPTWTVTNVSSTDAAKVKVTFGGPVPTGWGLAATGTDPDGTITLAPGASKTVSLTGANVSPAVGGFSALLNFVSDSNIAIAGKQAGFLGIDTKDLIINLSSNASQTAAVADQMTAAGYKVGVIADDGPLFDPNALGSNWSRFNHIFYNLGDQLGAFNTIANLQYASDYVNGGGKLLITATALASAYANGYVSSFQSAFHIQPKIGTAAPWTKSSKITGITGDPISDGLNTTLSGNLTYKQPLATGGSDCHAVFHDQGSTIVGVRVEMGSGKLVYLGFSVDTVATADRATLLQKIENYLDGVADVTPTTATGFSLDANYPNPLANSTSIGYSLPARQLVMLVVRDMLGRDIATLVNKVEEAGHYDVPFDASNLANGTYVYTLTAGDSKLEGKMTVNR